LRKRHYYRPREEAIVLWPKRKGRGAKRKGEGGEGLPEAKLTVPSFWGATSFGKGRRRKKSKSKEKKKTFSLSPSEVS